MTLGSTLLALMLAVGQGPRPVGDGRAALLSTDSAHGRSTATRGVDGFVSYLADDVVYLEPGSGHVRGKARVRTLLGGLPKGARLRFAPVTGAVSSDGRAGYTFGRTELSVPIPSGPTLRYGKYIAFWGKQADGSWKVEAWNRSGAAEGPAAEVVPPEPAGDHQSHGRGSPVATARPLLVVDSIFAGKSVAEGTAEAFSTYAAPDAVTLGGGKDFVLGRDAIRASFLAAGTPGEVLNWKPALAGPAPLDDLGWTVGRWVFTAPDRGGTHIVRGKYLTVWRRTREGWRFVVDGGSSNPEPGAR